MNAHGSWVHKESQNIIIIKIAGSSSDFRQDDSRSVFPFIHETMRFRCRHFTWLLLAGCRCAFLSAINFCVPPIFKIVCYCDTDTTDPVCFLFNNFASSVFFRRLLSLLSPSAAVLLLMMIWPIWSLKSLPVPRATEWRRRNNSSVRRDLFCSEWALVIKWSGCSSSPGFALQISDAQVRMSHSSFAAAAAVVERKSMIHRQIYERGGGGGSQKSEY